VAEMPKEDITAMVKDNYDPKNGGRGIQNYINRNIKPAISKTMLMGKNKAGKINIKYNKASKKPEMTFTAAAANNNQAATPQTSGATPAVAKPKAG